ncbi:MAG: hypothetical protein FWG71_03095 [Synergistaceae bacterium]|nr:hypothetical protein [Synergistaceae bacterium]
MMRENPIMVRYSHDGEYRFEIIDRKNGVLQVWVQKKIYDDYMGDWFSWTDIRDYAHIADSVKRAIEIGNEAIVNLTGGESQPSCPAK